MKQKKLSEAATIELLNTLQKRFEANTSRHKGIQWQHVQQRLEDHPEKLWSLNEMEVTGGAPDVVQYDKKTDQYVFFDCATESPKERRSLCYDLEAWEARKAHKPKSNAVDMANEMGVAILDEDQYRFLQQIGSFDLKTSSWLKTPHQIRNLGGAIFGDRRFDHVFIYHNGAESYYAARGFRTCLEV